MSSLPPSSFTDRETEAQSRRDPARPWQSKEFRSPGPIRLFALLPTPTPISLIALSLFSQVNHGDSQVQQVLSGGHCPVPTGVGWGWAADTISLCRDASLYVTVTVMIPPLYRTAPTGLRKKENQALLIHETKNLQVPLDPSPGSVFRSASLLVPGNFLSVGEGRQGQVQGGALS